MKKKVSYQEKVNKISADIIQLEKEITERQKRLSVLKESKTEAENSEIISIIRNADLSVDDIAELVSEFNMNNKTNPTNKVTLKGDAKQ